MNIYTDGSCLNNQSINRDLCFGGWGAIIIGIDEYIELSDGMVSTTNNEMELKAVVEVLKFIKEEKFEIKYM